MNQVHIDQRKQLSRSLEPRKGSGLLAGVAQADRSCWPAGGARGPGPGHRGYGTAIATHAVIAGVIVAGAS